MLTPAVQPIIRSVIQPIVQGIWQAFDDAGFNIRNLFAANEPGLSYDTDDLTTMFLDAAGTTPATVNGLVGLVLDKSRGLVTSGEIVLNGDFSTSSDWTLAAGAAITGGEVVFTASTGNSFQRIASEDNSFKYYEYEVVVTSASAGTLRFGIGASPSDTAQIVISSPGTYRVRRQYVGSTAYFYLVSSGFTGSVTSASLKRVSGVSAYQTTTGFKPILRGTPSGANLFASYGTPGAGWANSGGGVATGTATTGSIQTNVVPAASRVYRVRYTATVTSGTVRLTLGGVNGATRSASGTYEEYIAATSTAALSFQGVTAFTGTVSAIDVRDVSADSVTAPYGLQFDGADDFLQTASVDFSATDKMTVCAGVRKLSDANVAVVAELGASSSTNAGFGLFAPIIASPIYSYRSRGSTGPATISTPPSFASPITSVITAFSDIATDTCSIGVNGGAKTNDATDQGTGNYSNNPIFFGRRAGTSLPFNGLLYSPTILGRTATAAELANLERYTTRKTPTGA